MEKGSILPSPARTVDERVKTIPLPTQLPKGVDFSEIPMAAIKSATLESLISQNEDLMARLSVALRKIHELEDAASAHEQDKKTLATRFATLKEQFLILQEKDKSSTERGLKQYQENLLLKGQGDKLERLYADLYSEAQGLQKRLVRLERYRARIRRIAPPMQKKAKLIRLLEREIIEHKIRLSAQATALREEFEAKLAAADQKLAETKTALHAEHQLNIESIESRLREAEAELAVLRPKAEERDSVYENLLKSENQRVFDQRQFEQSRTDADAVVERLERETSALRLELKEVIVDREAKTQELTRLAAEIPHLRERNQNLLEQVESLQALWNQKQREIDQLEEKNRSLQKLNQSLSVTLNQQRKEIHALKTDLDHERFSAEEKIKALNVEIQLLREGSTKL